LFKPCVNAGAQTIVEAVPLMLMMRPGTVARHQGQKCARHSQRPENLVVEVAEPVAIWPQNLTVHPPHRPTGVVDHDVYGAEGLLRRRRARIDLIGLGDIGGGSHHFHAGLFMNLLGCAVEQFLAARKQHQIHALAGQTACNGSPDPFTATSDQCRSAF
jgi:hypothetical protein